MSYGYSAFELIKTIDNAAALIKKLKDAPRELDSIKKRVQFGQLFLRSLQKQIAEHAVSLSDSDQELLNDIYEEYDGALVELQAFTRKHAKLENGRLGRRLVWVTAEHFKGEREELSKVLKAVEIRINLMLQKLNWDASLQLLRSNSVASPIAEAVPESDLSALSQQNFQAQSADRLTQDGQSRYTLSISGHDISDETVSNTLARSNALGIVPYLSPYQDMDMEGTLQDFTFEQPIQADGEGRSDQTSSDPIPITRHRVPTSFSASPTNRTEALGGSPGTVYTATPSIFDSAASVSSQSDASTPRHSMTSPNCPSSEYARPNSYGRSESTPDVSDQGHNNGYRRGTSLASLSPSPGRNALARFAEELMLQGTMKVWYKVGSQRVSRTIIRIRIEGECAGFTSKIRLTTDDGRVRIHEAVNPTPDLTKSFHQLHPECIDHVSNMDPEAHFVVSFIGSHTLTRLGENNPSFRGRPEYAFTNERDCWNFQRCVSSGKLLGNVDTTTILSAGNRPLSVWQVLQIWITEGERSIRFLGNDNERAHDNAQYLVPIVSIKATSLYPIELTTTADSLLKLALRSGSENAEELGKLKITLTKEVARERTTRTRRSFGSRERRTVPAEESEKERLLKLAQFGTG